MQNHITASVHIVADLWGCDKNLLNERDALVRLIFDAAERSNSTVLDQTSFQFSPQGVTAILLLAESHISIHTWPEEGYAAVDIFSCGVTMQPQVCADIIKTGLGAKHAEVSSMRRGIPSKSPEITT